jgi:hypothetical protein
VGAVASMGGKYPSNVWNPKCPEGTPYYPLWRYSTGKASAAFDAAEVIALRDTVQQKLPGQITVQPRLLSDGKTRITRISASRNGCARYPDLIAGSSSLRGRDGPVVKPFTSGTG